MEIRPKAYQDPETLLIYEIYPIENAKQISFNLNGELFKFEHFLFILTRTEDLISKIFIQVPKISFENLSKIAKYLKIPSIKESWENNENLTIRLELKKEAIEKFINSNFSSIKTLKNLFELKDEMNGSILFDFYYYDVVYAEEVYLPLIREISLQS